MNISVILGLLLGCSVVANAEYYTSMVGLEELLKTEQILLTDLKDYLVATKQKNFALENEISKILMEHKQATDDPENYLTNPVNVFRLIKRLYNDWWKYLPDANDFLQRVHYTFKEMAFPSYDDFEESALALMRLQKTYNLDVTELASGILNGVKYGANMSWTDCLHMGQQLVNVGAFNHSKPWIREFYSLFNSNYGAISNVKETLKSNLMEVGDVEITLQIFNAILENDWSTFGDLAEMYKIKYIYSDAYVEEQDYHSSHEYQLYEQVCREEVTQTPAEQRDLRCRYHWGECDFCRLAPFKMEEMNLDPIVMVFHNMVSDKQIEVIKATALPHMYRSTVRNDYGDASKRDNYRLSKNAWLHYDVHPSTLKLLRDLDDATGLNMSESEEMQVANYGFGGHYEPHFDFYLTVVDEVQNNRLSTSMVYLSDVEQGGATAFPFLKIAVKPAKGDVLFWYNLHRSLDGDFRTKHAGCPVLKGSKWIGNVWTPDINQASRRPCGLSRDHEVSLEYQYVK